MATIEELDHRDRRTPTTRRRQRGHPSAAGAQGPLQRAVGPEVLGRQPRRPGHTGRPSPRRSPTCSLPTRSGTEVPGSEWRPAGRPSLLDSAPQHSPLRAILFVKPQIQVSGDRATARWDLLCPCRLMDGSSYWMCGFEDDTYIRTSDTWLQQSMTLTTLFMSSVARGLDERFWPRTFGGVVPPGEPTGCSFILSRRAPGGLDPCRPDSAGAQ